MTGERTAKRNGAVPSRCPARSEPSARGQTESEGQRCRRDPESVTEAPRAPGSAYGEGTRGGERTQPARTEPRPHRGGAGLVRRAGHVGRAAQSGSTTRSWPCTRAVPPGGASRVPRSRAGATRDDGTDQSRGASRGKGPIATCGRRVGLTANPRRRVRGVPGPPANGRHAVAGATVPANGRRAERPIARGSGGGAGL